MTNTPILTRPGPEMMQRATQIVDSLGVMGSVAFCRASDALLMGALIHAIILHRLRASAALAHPMVNAAMLWVEAQAETEASLRAAASRHLTSTEDAGDEA